MSHTTVDDAAAAAADTTTAWKKFSGARALYPEWRDSTCLFATTASASHHLGLLGSIISPAEYALWATTLETPNPAPFALLPAPGEMPAAGAQFGGWQYTANEYRQEQVDRLAFRKVLLSKIDPGSIRAMSEANTNFGVTRRSVAWIIAWMDTKYGTATPETIAEAQDSMDVPFVDNGELTVVQYMDRHHAIPHRVAATNGGPYPETTKVRKLIVGLSQCGEFKETISFFRLTHKTALAQTYALLSNMIEEAEPTRAAQKTSSGSGLINQAITDPFVKTLLDKIEAMQTAIVALSANAAVISPKRLPPRGTPTTGGGGGKKKEKAFYCWTHGPNNSHNSADCSRPHADHQDTATYRNKMGGAAVFTRSTTTTTDYK